LPTGTAGPFPFGVSRSGQRDCLYLMLVSGPGREEARAFYAALSYGESRGFKKRL